MWLLQVRHKSKNMELRGVSLSSKVYDDISNSVQKSYPNACVLYVDEIINDALHAKYTARKTSVEEARGVDNVKELSLFHGTKAYYINSIAQDGFLTQHNKVSAYGKGTYFSTTAMYSRNYTDKDDMDVSYMFVCDVIVGNCTVINGPGTIDTALYDNSTNMKHKPTIYVTPYDDGAYPKYLVAFHKNAK